MRSSGLAGLLGQGTQQPPNSARDLVSKNVTVLEEDVRLLASVFMLMHAHTQTHKVTLKISCLC